MHMGNLHKAAVLLLALAVVLAAVGCTTISPKDMVPAPIAPAPAGQRFDGTVSVGVTIDVRALRYVRPRQAVSVDELAILTGLSTQALGDAVAAAGSLGSNPAVFWTSSAPAKRGVAPALAAFEPRFAADWARENAPLIKSAVEQALASSRLFPRVAPSKGDYALDIWLDGLEPTTPPMGMGTWKADVLAVWRLTRASDGAILACDFAQGHGSFRKARSRPNQWAFAAATQDLIDGILRALGDDPQKHLAALEPAGLGRVGAAGAQPVAARQWNERVSANWPQLRAGMDASEVSALIGPVGAPVEGWDCRFVLPVTWKLTGSQDTPPGGGTVIYLAFRVYRTDFTTLLFLVDEAPRSPAETSAPGLEFLLAWELRKK